MLSNLQKEVELVGRHLEVLGHVADAEPIGIERLADETGHPFHKVRYSLRVLEDEGLVRPTDSGAVTTDETERYPTEFDDHLGDFAERVEALKGIGAAARPAD